MDDFIPLNLFGDKEPEGINTISEEMIDEKSISAEDTIQPKIAEKSADTNDIVPDNPTNKETGIVDGSKEACAETAVSLAPEKSMADDIYEKAFESQQQIFDRIDSLHKLFEARIMHTEHEEKIVDQMHRELQKNKEDLYAQLIRPILVDVIELRDSIMRMATNYIAKPEGEQDIPNKTFSGYAFDLQDILEKNGVEIYRSNPREDFTPIKQRAIKKLTTPNESLHGKVAESLSCGYNYNGRVISTEKVAVYYYEKPVNEIENSEVIENG